jgi:putative DNA primase/helicase
MRIENHPQTEPSESNFILNPQVHGENEASTEINAILDVPISVFNGTNPEPISTSTVKEILNGIQSGIYQEKIKWVRSALPDRAEYTRRKKTLPAVTFGCCVRYRGLEINPQNPKSGPQNLISVTQLIILDLDHLGDKFESIRKTLQSDPNILACFKSPGGDGLKVIVYSPGIQTKEDHLRFYYAAERYFRETYDLNIDPACKDLARLCYVSDDPDLYLNPNTSAFNIDVWTPTAIPRSETRIQPVIPSSQVEEWQRIYGRKVLESACQKIRQASLGEMHITRRDNARLVGGYVASAFIKESEALEALEQAVKDSNTTSPAEAMKTIQEGLRHGMQSPIFIEKRQPAIAENWPEPDPLPVGLKSVEPFTYGLLPDRIRPWVMDISDRMQCPPDFPAVGAMIVLASLIGRKVGIYPKVHDVWFVIVNLWGLFVGRPAEMKTPVLNEITKPLKQLEVEAKKVFLEAEKEYDVVTQRAKIQQELVMAEAKKELKSGKSTAVVDQLFLDLDKSIGEPPTRKRYIVNDATVEKLGILLNENPNGLLLIRDEISGWLKTINRGDRPNDRAFYLEAWEGSGRYTYDRISRGTLDIESLCVSIIGSIQPGKLASIARAAIIGGNADDGFIQRFQLAVYPDHKQQLYIVDRRPDKDARNNAFELMQQIAGLPVPDAGQEVPGLHFSPEAQVLFYECLTELENEIRGEDIHPVMESHLAKYRSLIPSLALICHLANSIEIDLSLPVSLESLQKALGWYEYLKSHAERIYGMVMNGHTTGAKTILGKIAKGILSNPFKRRDIQRGNWAGLTEPEDIDGALSILEDYGYVQPVPHRPTPLGHKR